MSDFGASYAEMESVAGKLDTGREDISGVLKDLKSQVDTLLGEDFKTQHASGKFGEGYEELTTGLEQAIEEYGSLGQQGLPAEGAEEEPPPSTGEEQP